MKKDEILFDGKVNASYYQVALKDIENKDGYPQWKTGDEIIVFGSYGVVVVTANDQEIDIIVTSSKVDLEYSLCVSGEIIVGQKGILVGNITSADTTCIEVRPGKYSVTVYTDKFGPETTRVVFCINRLEEK